MKTTVLRLSVFVLCMVAYVTLPITIQAQPI